MEQFKGMKHKLLSALMAALIFLAGGFVSAATANDGSGLKAMVTALIMPSSGTDQVAVAETKSGVSQLNVITAKATDQEGAIVHQGEGNGSWAWLQARPDAEGAMAAIGSSRSILYAESKSGDDTLSGHKVILAQAGGVFI